MKRMPPLSIHAVFSLLMLFSGTNAVAEIHPIPQCLESELDAVVVAAQQYNPQSIQEDREFMGVILNRGDCYSFTVGAGEPGKDRITVKVTVPEGSRVVAFWHTHGGKRHSNRYFSNVDTDLVDTWKKPFFLVDYTGLLKVFLPGAPKLSKSHARRLGLPPRAGYARGEFVNDVRGKPVRIATRS